MTNYSNAIVCMHCTSFMKCQFPDLIMLLCKINKCNVESYVGLACPPHDLLLTGRSISEQMANACQSHFNKYQCSDIGKAIINNGNQNDRQS